MTNLEQWKQWFDQWNIIYHEEENANERVLSLDDCNECFADVVFDLSGKFVCVDCGRENS